MVSSALKASMIELKAHKNRLSRIHMRQVFADDPKRFAKFALCIENMVFDYSRNRIDTPSMKSLISLVKSAGIKKMRERMFSGALINETEDRAVLHTALRNRSDDPVFVSGKDVMPDVKKSHRAMARFANSVRSGKYAVTGGRITDVVNIGIGGSDLGPAMTTLALSPYHTGPRTHFVSNVDGADLASVLDQISPQTTLFIIASKSFTTQETMTNAFSARKWMRRKLGTKQTGRHFVALSTNLEATRKFGISDNHTFGFWDWVGGRYSIWSAIGLSLMIAIGPKRFNQFLDGAYSADKHFREASFDKNIPVIMALLEIWYRNVWDYTTRAILPYDNRLAKFPAYLQQLEMESNGKSVLMDGKAATKDTGAIIWGEPGTNGQHAFYQLIHQGTSVIPCDFHIAALPHEKMGDHHKLLVANCLAQSEALMVGKNLSEVKQELKDKGFSKADINKLAPHKVFEGNRPSTTFMYEKLDPKTLGMLIALYEHKVFVQGVILGINSFDQWGVELGKKLAVDLLPMVKDEDAAIGKDVSTSGLLRTYHEFLKR